MVGINRQRRSLSVAGETAASPSPVFVASDLPSDNLLHRQRQRLRRQRYFAQANLFAVPSAIPAKWAKAKAREPVEQRPPSDEQVEVLRNQLLRTRADLENLRKRVQREKAEITKFCLERLMKELIGVVDNFDRALATPSSGTESSAFTDGIRLIHQHLYDILTKQGLKKIPAKGQKFDPHLHEAVGADETTDVPEGTIVEVLQEGYTLNDRVIRPALVRVAARPAAVKDR